MLILKNLKDQIYLNCFQKSFYFFIKNFRKWLQKSITILNALITNDDDDDDEGSESVSESDN
jgi:hypothetical protein